MKIKVTDNEFPDIVVSFLLDNIIHDDKVLKYGNDDFNAFMDILNRKGFKSILMRYYVNMNPNTRTDYKRIKDVFRDDKSMKTALIEINKTKTTEKQKKGALSKIKYVAKILIGG